MFSIYHIYPSCNYLFRAATFTYAFSSVNPYRGGLIPLKGPFIDFIQTPFSSKLCELPQVLCEKKVDELGNLLGAGWVRAWEQHRDCTKCHHQPTPSLGRKRKEICTHLGFTSPFQTCFQVLSTVNNEYQLFFSFFPSRFLPVLEEKSCP